MEPYNFEFHWNRTSIAIVLLNILQHIGQGSNSSNNNNSNNSNNSDHVTMSPYVPESCDIFYFTVEGVIGLMICAVGLSGNFLSLLIIHTIGKSSVTFFLFRSLALVDTFYLTTYGLTIVTSALMLYFDEVKAYFSVYQYLVFVVFPFSSMALTVTSWVTALLTIHRYIAVCKPLRVLHLSTLRGVKIQILCVILLSYIIEIPRYWESYIDTYSYDDHLYYVHVASALWMSYLYQLLYKTIFMVTVRILAPLLITLVLTVKLTVTVRRARKIRSGLVAANNGGDQNVIKHYKSVKSNETVTLVLIIIAVMFIVCQTPGMIYPLFRLTLKMDTCDDFFYYYATIADALSALKSALNFFVYYLLVPAFRAHLRKLFHSKRMRRQVQPQRSASYKVTVVSH